MSQKTTVAFQGERRAFSEEAARKLLGEKMTLVPLPTFAEVFDAVEEGRASSAIVPIENSLAGSVYENYDLLLQKNLTIAGEVNLRILHCLLALPRASLGEIKKVYSHPVALAQCQDFFRRQKQLEPIPSYDTAGSAKMIQERKLADSAAIASHLAAEIYGMQVLEEGIEDNKENYTRFLLLAPGSQIPAGANKTSIVFSLPHQPGTLFKSLSVFALRDINLTKIESRPLHGRPWEYFFYIDFLGSMGEARCQKAIEHLRELADFLKILGSYPKAEDK